MMWTSMGKVLRGNGSARDGARWRGVPPFVGAGSSADGRGPQDGRWRAALRETLVRQGKRIQARVSEREAGKG